MELKLCELQKMIYVYVQDVFKKVHENACGDKTVHDFPKYFARIFDFHVLWTFQAIRDCVRCVCIPGAILPERAWVQQYTRKHKQR